MNDFWTCCVSRKYEKQNKKENRKGNKTEIKERKIKKTINEKNRGKEARRV
jgi:hypothetical protein